MKLFGRHPHWTGSNAVLMPLVTLLTISCGSGTELTKIRGNEPAAPQSDPGPTVATTSRGLSGRAPSGITSVGALFVSGARKGAIVRTTPSADGSFELALPKRQAAILVFYKQTRPIANLVFDTDRRASREAGHVLPGEDEHDVDLGDVEIEGHSALAENNPLGSMDEDSDGEVDLDDADDDDDGILDEEDADADGNGANDEEEALDADRDGAADVCDEDDDGDGRHDGEDSDDDGDGVHDRDEPDHDGDGIEDHEDADVDNDGEEETDRERECSCNEDDREDGIEEGHDDLGEDGQHEEGGELDREGENGQHEEGGELDREGEDGQHEEGGELDREGEDGQHEGGEECPPADVEGEGDGHEETSGDGEAAEEGASEGSGEEGAAEDAESPEEGTHEDGR